MTDILEEKHFKDKKGQEYLLTITQDEYCDFKDLFPEASIHFVGWGKQHFSNLNPSQPEDDIIDKEIGKIELATPKELKEVNEKTLKALEEKGCIALPLDAYSHGGTKFYPYSYHENSEYQKPSDIVGYLYITKEMQEQYGLTGFSKERMQKELEAMLETFNQWNNGEVYNIDLYRCVPEGVGYKKSAMESIEGTLVFAEPEDSLCGNLRDGIEEYVEDLKKKGFEEITRGQER